jgi:hypothetical protein
MTGKICNEVDGMKRPLELNPESESERSNARRSEPLALIDDGMKALFFGWTPGEGEIDNRRGNNGRSN